MFTENDDSRTVWKTLLSVACGVGVFKIGKRLGQESGYHYGYQRCQLEELERLREEQLQNKG